MTTSGPLYTVDGRANINRSVRLVRSVILRPATAYSAEARMVASL